MKDGVLRELSFPIMELNEIPRGCMLYSRSLIENKVIPFAHDLLDKQFIIDNAYDDFIEFSKEYDFPELLKSKKKLHILCNKD